MTLHFQSNLMKSIPYGKQEISAEDISAVTEALQSEFLTQGPKVNEFEQAFCDYVGSKYAVAVSNGTAALHLCALALGVGSNSKVIATPITFAASSNCILYCGGTVEFVDIDQDSGIIDILGIKKLLESRPKGYYQGIVPVDFAGYPVNGEKIKELATEYGLWVLEDACHAPGAFFTDSHGIQRKCGSNQYADLSIFSFHPVKHIATGEGGMITTNNESLYRKLLKLRTHGITKDENQLEKVDGGWYYEMQELGFNYRIPDILCALGLSQLKMAESRLRKRIEIADRYDQAFGSVDSIKPLYNNRKLRSEGIQHAYHLYIVRVKNRLEVYNKLREKKIYTQVHYIPVYSMPFYQRNGYAGVSCPNAERYYRECLSLPMYPSLTEEEQDYVIKSILESI